MIRAFLAAVLAVAPAIAEARRLVDYTIDDATWSAWASEQMLASPKSYPAPPRGASVVLAPGLDHEVVRAGQYCSAWTVSNPVSTLLARAFAGWRGGTASAWQLKVTSARTVSRCFEVKEFSDRCLTRVVLTAELAPSAGGTPVPVRAEVERQTNLVGACAGLTRGVALVSREAATELAERAAALATAPEVGAPAPPVGAAP